MYRWRQIAPAVVTSSHGSAITCRFCAHENAAGSKFCSECGGALNLLPCPRCGAVNDVKKNFCYQCRHQLSGCATDDTAAEDLTPLSRQCSEEPDEAAIFVEIKQLYDGNSQSDVGRPDNVTPGLSKAKDFTPLSRQPFQEPDEAAIFAEIKQLYDGVSQTTDDFNRPASSSDVDRPDDVAPRLSAAQDLTPSSRPCPEVRVESPTRFKIKELYYSNLRRRTPRYDRPSQPDDLAPRLLVAEGNSSFGQGLSKTIIAIAILAAIVVLNYYEYHQRFLGDALRSWVVKREERANEGPVGAGDIRRDRATVTTIPAQNTQRAPTQQKTVVWDARKVNNFWKGVIGKTADPLPNPVAKKPEPAATPAHEPAAPPALEPAAAPASQPAAALAPEPAPIATTGTERSAPTPARRAAVPASPPPKKTTSVPSSTFEGELASATAPAIVSFAIAPWGEIYVDGQRRGVNPPMRELELGPGQYEVEVRNTSFPAFVQTIKVEAGTHIKIKHQFR